MGMLPMGILTRGDAKERVETKSKLIILSAIQEIIEELKYKNIYATNDHIWVDLIKINYRSPTCNQETYECGPNCHQIAFTCLATHPPWLYFEINQMNFTYGHKIDLHDPDSTQVIRENIQAAITEKLDPKIYDILA